MPASIVCRCLILAALIVFDATLVNAQVRIPASTRPDFNGDGKDDLAIGVPGENTGAGGVHIIYGATTALNPAGNQYFSQDTAGVPGGEQDYDSCGTSLASGDFNGDGYADLAFGCPGEDAPSADSSGAVIVLYGSATRLTSTGSQYWGQNSAGISGGSEPFDRCGQSLASGDINRDGFADLIWGCSGEDVGDLDAAGAVNVLFGSASGLTATGNRFLSQDTTGIPDTAEGGDGCGTTVAAGDFNGDGFADVAWGCPREDIGFFIDAGAVSVAFGIASGVSPGAGLLLTQDTDNRLEQNGVEAFDLCGQGLATGDFNGDGRGDLVFGCPGEDHFVSLDIGSIYVLFGTSSNTMNNGQIVYHTANSGRCGAAIAVGRFNSGALDDLAFGCPDANGFGRVYVMVGDASTRVVVFREFDQNTFGVPDTNEAGDNFGHAVATGDFDGNGFSDLAIGAPDEDLAAGNSVGTVTVIYSPMADVLNQVRAEFYHQDTPNILNGAEQLDKFGFSLAGSGQTPLPGLTGRWDDDVRFWCRGASCSLTGTFTALNPSTLPTPAVTVRFYLSGDEVLDDGDVLVATMPVKPLDMDESQVRTLHAVVPQHVGGPGSYLIAFVDADDEVVEVNEANNIVVTPIP